MKPKDLPIIVKLLVAPAALIIIMVAVILVVNKSFDGTEQALGQLLTSLRQQSRLLADAQRRATAVQGEMYRIVGLLGTEGEPAQIRELAGAVIEEIEGIEADFRRLPEISEMPSEEHEITLSVLSALEAYRESVEGTIQGLESGMPIAIMFIVGIEQTYDRVRQRIARLAEINDRISQSVYSDALKQAQRSRILSLVMLVAAILVGVVLTYLAHRLISRPITAITSTMTTVAKGGGTDLPVPGRDRRDEIGAMAQALEVFKNHANEIKGLLGELQEAKAQLEDLNHTLEARVERRTAELQEAQDQLLRKERLATLGQLTATVSHELRNPLGALRTAVATITRLADDEPSLMKSSVEIADRSVTRCDNIISDLLDYTRLRPLQLENTDIDAWICEVLDEYMLPAGIDLQRQLGSHVHLAIDHDRIRRTVLNLLDNACHAMAEEVGGAEERILTVSTRLARERLELTIGDTGAGISSEDMERVFEPLYSTKSFGVGLGLTIVRQSVESHGGGVELSSGQGRGTQVRLWLPLEVADQRAVS